MSQKIIEIISKGENIKVEFKESKIKLNKDVYETICSFLNRKGGEIFLGVKDNGEIIGVEKDKVEQIKKDFVTVMNNGNKLCPTFYLNIEEFEIEDKTILYIFVPESSQVHRCNGKIFDRNQDGDLDITNSTELVANMFIRKQKGFSENEIFPYATINELNSILIEKVRKMAVIRNSEHPWKDMRNEELLRSAGLIQNDLKTGKKGFTLACILLFGTNEAINSVAPHHKTDAILRRINLDRYDDRDDIRCNLIESYERLMKFVEKHLSDPFYLENDVRISVRNNLFREVIANTLIHREYSNHYPARFIIGNDNVTVENGNCPHGFGEINIDNFMPFPKNPNIARVFKEIGWADELGSGIKNLKKFCKIYSDSKPVFIDGDVFKTVITLNEVDRKNTDVSINKEHQNNNLQKANEKKRTKKSERKKANEKNRINIIINHVKENGYITTTQAMKLLNLGKTRTYEILFKMVNQEVLVKKSAGRTTQYVLAEPIK